MDVLLIHDHKEPDAGAQSTPVGGIGVYVKNIADELAKQGDRVSLLRLYPASEDTPPRREAGSYAAPASSIVRRPVVDGKILDLVDRIKPDVIHLQSTYYSLGPWLMDLLSARARTILTQHDVTPFCPAETMLRYGDTICGRPAGASCVLTGCYQPGAKGPLLKDVVRLMKSPAKLYAMARLERIIVPSAYLRDIAVRNGLDPHRLSILPNFSRFGTPDSCPAGGGNILFVGRFTVEKGIHHLCAALRKLRTGNWTATFVGAGPLEPTLRQQLAQEDLLPRVRFATWAAGAALSNFYREAAVVVVPSLMPESFGMVGVEALGFGRGVVGYRSGGMEEWLGRSEASIAVSRGDIASLAEGIDNVLSNPGRFFEPARYLVRTQFSGAQHIARLRSIYESVGNGPRSGSTGGQERPGKAAGAGGGLSAIRRLP